MATHTPVTSHKTDISAHLNCLRADMKDVQPLKLKGLQHTGLCPQTQAIQTTLHIYTHVCMNTQGFYAKQKTTIPCQDSWAAFSCAWCNPQLGHAGSRSARWIPQPNGNLQESFPEIGHWCNGYTSLCLCSLIPLVFWGAQCGTCVQLSFLSAAFGVIAKRENRHALPLLQRHKGWEERG